MWQRPLPAATREGHPVFLQMHPPLSTRPKQPWKYHFYPNTFRFAPSPLPALIPPSMQVFVWRSGESIARTVVGPPGHMKSTEDYAR